MELKEGIELAQAHVETLLAGSDWKLDWTRSRDYAGYCNYDKGLIVLSIPYILEHPREDVEDVIIHEIGHAYVGPGHGHDNEWKKTTRRLGGSGKQFVTIPKTLDVPTQLAVVVSVGFGMHVLGRDALLAYVALVALYYGRRMWKRFGPMRKVYKLGCL